MEGRIPFRIAIVAIVVGLLALTSAALIAYGVYANQRNYEILKRDYLEQVAEATAREVARLPRAAGQLLWVAPLVAHFSKQRKLSRKDIAELRKLLEELDDGQR